jgi:hypothetical protein
VCCNHKKRPTGALQCSHLTYNENRIGGALQLRCLADHQWLASADQN